MEDKYKTLEEKYKTLEEKFVKDQDIVHSPTSEDDISEGKVFSDILSKINEWRTMFRKIRYIMFQIC